MHHIYHTEGLILGSKSYGEAGKYYSIFTRDLGMVHASAQGVRKMSSKLRFILQDFAYVKVDLVQGKDFWRVTSASKTNKLGEITKRKENFQVFSNIANLLKRLLAGQEPNSKLFSVVLSGLENLQKSSLAELPDTETNLVAHILGGLGYMDTSSMPKNRKLILPLINKALKETHL